MRLGSQELSHCRYKWIACLNVSSSLHGWFALRAHYPEKIGARQFCCQDWKGDHHAKSSCRWRFLQLCWLHGFHVLSSSNLQKINYHLLCLSLWSPTHRRCRRLQFHCTHLDFSALSPYQNHMNVTIVFQELNAWYMYPTPVVALISMISQRTRIFKTSHRGLIIPLVTRLPTPSWTWKLLNCCRMWAPCGNLILLGDETCYCQHSSHSPEWSSSLEDRLFLGSATLTKAKHWWLHCPICRGLVFATCAGCAHTATETQQCLAVTHFSRYTEKVSLRFQ